MNTKLTIFRTRKSTPNPCTGYSVLLDGKRLSRKSPWNKSCGWCRHILTYQQAKLRLECQMSNVVFTAAIIYRKDFTWHTYRETYSEESIPKIANLQAAFDVSGLGEMKRVEDDLNQKRSSQSFKRGSKDIKFRSLPGNSV